MNSLTVREKQVPDYGKCLEISNGSAELLVTLDFGPRIIRFALCGGENFLFEDPAREARNDSEILKAVFGRDSVFYNYGGHRMWLSPEDMPLSYYPDNDPVSWKKTGAGVELLPSPQRVNNVQVRFEVEMDEKESAVSVRHFVTNTGESDLHKAIWGITMLGKGGLEIIPVPLNDTGLLPNRSIALWPYADMTDGRVYWGKKVITLRQEPSVKSAFKVGVSNNRGWAAYLNHGGMFIKRFRYNAKGDYPDFGMTFESYVNHQFLECESLGELSYLTPGSTACHAERWELVDGVKRPEPNDEAAIAAIIARYIETEK